MVELGTVAERTYRELRDRAVMFQFKPGMPIKEVALAKELNVSRTPLREALNRLASEGFVETTQNRGFTGRRLDPKEIFDLYELRVELEVLAARLACKRATDEQLRELSKFCRTEGQKRFHERVSVQLEVDEKFHESIARASGNAQLERVLRNYNARIRFARWIDMEGQLHTTDNEHLYIVAALESRDADRCAELLRGHIERRMDQIRDVIKEGFARIYMSDREGTTGGAE